MRVAVEFRQRRLMDDQHRDGTISFLAERGLVYVCVDEPPSLASTVPPVAVATAVRNARTLAILLADGVVERS